MLPDQAPEAVHDVASVADQFKIALPPLATVLGVAVMVTLGGVSATVTVTDCVAVPPSPVQVRSNSVVVASAPVDCEPLVGTTPLQPPEAWHDVAFRALHVRVAAPPLLTVDGSADSVTLGGSVTTTSAVCVADPPLPVQVSVNEVVAVRATMEV